MPNINPLPTDDAPWLTSLKTTILAAQQRASLAVNRKPVSLSWQIGRDVAERQRNEGWAANAINKTLAADMEENDAP